MSEAGTIKIAGLVACYNRKEKTIQFLESLMKQIASQDFTFDIYLLDDGSTDDTAEAVKERYPAVNIVKGSGNLFWARSMRKIWQHAQTQKSYDLFFLFNDDVVLFDDAIEKLLFFHSQSLSSKGTVLLGSTLDPVTNEISYGGNIFNVHPFKLTEFYRITPDNNKLITCKFGNGNILLTDKTTVEKIGIFSDLYIQSFSDFDYTHTAYKAGVKVLIAPGYYGYCRAEYKAHWLPAKTTLKERIKYLYSPKGLSLKEYLRFLKKHFPSSYLTELAKAWLKTLLPVIWDKFEKKKAPLKSINYK